MKRGHPFHNEELDDLRARQRALLWATPSFFLEKSRAVIQLPPGLERVAIELEFRRLADDETEALEDFLRQSADARNAEVARRALSQALGSGDVNSAHFDAMSKTLGERIMETPNQIPDDVLGPLYRFVVLALWADQLAGDYEDPRVT
jgi:hypothetical protein